jgi:glycerol-3-phosphate O-acyltransferase
MIDEGRVVSEVVARIVERALAQAPGGRPVEELVNETLYHERERLKRARGDRADADRAFYSRVQHDLPRASPAAQRQLLNAIVHRYAEEISGHFDPKVYAVATRALPFGLNVLVTSLSPRTLFDQSREAKALARLDQQLIIEGEVEHLRRLQKRGTVLLTPTHSSNLDSVLMGWAVYRMGLPPVTYGAGLNLFTNRIIGYFMNHLGAYTVDRLKTDPLYRDTLKEYATVTLEFGQDGLFFPGGTRSRSGAVESRLKKGLLGTSLAAFRNNLQHGKKGRERCYVVPVTIGYPLVLEAQTLIDDFLAEQGRSRFIIVDDEFSIFRRWLDFLRGLLEIDLRIHLRVGRALDPFGNDVDDDGRSHDPRGREVDPARYLMVGGELVDDAARDQEYTSLLADRIVDRFRCETVLQPTNVLAFVFLELLRRQHWHGDLYRFLRTLGPEVSVAQPQVEQELSRALAELRHLQHQGKVRLAPEVARGDEAEVLRAALRSFGTYHTVPAIERRGVRLHVGDAKLVFYYRNRLEGFGLLGAPALLQRRAES